MNIKNELTKELLLYAFLILIIYLFYRSVFGFVLLIPVIIYYRKTYRRRLREKYRQELSLQFKDALISMTAALRAGYSAENSIKESLREMSVMYGEKSPICLELSKVSNSIRLGVSTEDALEAFAASSGSEDIITFSEVFRIAKRSGGDLVDIIRKTSDDITAKIDTKNEIAVTISSKKLEQNLLFLMPPGIILYIDLTSPDILAPLYGNILGVLIMTVCLGVYAGAYFLAQKIMKIEV